MACHTKVPLVQLYLHSIPLELLKACVHDVASRISLACRPIPASSRGKILLDFWLLAAVRRWYVRRIADETPPGIMVTANLAVFAITGVSGHDNVIAWAKGDGS